MGLEFTIVSDILEKTAGSPVRRDIMNMDLGLRLMHEAAQSN
jgi:hypothetical protein